MRFLIIPEDSRNDRYILEPLVHGLLEQAGYRRPKCRICNDPHLGGVSEALKSARLREVFDRYAGMVDVFLLCVDRDAERGRQRRLDDLEEEFSGERFTFIATQAWEEVETWALAGAALPGEWAWADVRRARDVKEDFFEPYVEIMGLQNDPGGGRRFLGRQAATNLQRVRQLCPEFDAFGTRLSEIL